MGQLGLEGETGVRGLVALDPGGQVGDAVLANRAALVEAQGAYSAAQSDVLAREAAYRQSLERVRISRRQLIDGDRQPWIPDLSRQRSQAH